jgi:hypothetical protein
MNATGIKASTTWKKEEKKAIRIGARDKTHTFKMTDLLVNEEKRNA